MLRRQVKHIANKLHHEQYETYNLIELSRKNLLHNLRIVHEQNPGKQIIPVIKSNAYGHGLQQIAKILDDAKVQMVAVDGYFEASMLLDTTSFHILVMGAIHPDNVGLLNTKRCSFVVQDIVGLEAFGSLNKKVRVHMELNTGMNRLGLSGNELSSYLATLKKYPKLQLEGIMSHLADADSSKLEFTKMQLASFENAISVITKQGWKPTFVHLAQTAGSTKVKSKHLNAIRLGIGLYGINPLLPYDSKYKQLDKLQPVLSLKSTIIKIQELKKGDKVSYNGIFTAPKSMRIGVLPLGYYEGYPRALSNVGIMTHAGEKLPVVGRVCMNHTMIDITNSTAKVGTVVTIIDADKQALNSVASICEKHDLFSYQLLTGLSERVRRVII